MGILAGVLRQLFTFNFQPSTLSPTFAARNKVPPSMINRRNIRVKVMQALYALDSLGAEVKPNEPQLILQKKIDQTRQLFIYLVFFITEIARYAEKNARIKASKHLPTAADLVVNTKITVNRIFRKIIFNVFPVVKKKLPDYKIILVEFKQIEVFSGVIDLDQII